MCSDYCVAVCISSTLFWVDILHFTCRAPPQRSSWRGSRRASSPCRGRSGTESPMLLRVSSKVNYLKLIRHNIYMPKIRPTILLFTAIVTLYSLPQVCLQSKPSSVWPFRISPHIPGSTMSPPLPHHYRPAVSWATAKPQPLLSSRLSVLSTKPPRLASP